MVEDIEALRKALHINHWVVLGHSFGGMLASYYAATFPHAVDGLILSSSGGVDMSLFQQLNITGRLNAQQKDSLAYWNAKIAEGDSSYHARLQRGKQLAPAYLYDTSHVGAVAHRLTQSNLQVNGWVFQDMRNTNFDCKAALRNFNKPVLIIQGKEDIIPESIARLAHDVFPRSEVVLMERCGHYGWLDRPDVYFARIHDYFRNIMY